MRPKRLRLASILAFPDAGDVEDSVGGEEATHPGPSMNNTQVSCLVALTIEGRVSRTSDRRGPLEPSDLGPLGHRQTPALRRGS